MNICIFCLPCFLSPNDENVTGGYISNYYLLQAVAKTKKTFLISPGNRTTEYLPSELHEHLHVDIEKSTGFLGRIAFMKKIGEKLDRFIAENDRYRMTIFFSTTSAGLACRYKNNEKIRTVIICRAYEDFIFSNYTPVKEPRLRCYAKQLADRGKTRKSYKTANLVLTNSKWMCEAVKKSFGENIKTDFLYPPLDLHRKKSESKNYFTGSIGFINRGKSKGGELVKKLAARMPECVFHIYGTKMQSDLKNISVHGWTPRETIFQNCSIFIIPTIGPEPFGRVAIEARANGIPVVASRDGGLPEAVENTDLLVSDNEPGSWEEKLSAIIKDYSRYQREVESAREKIYRKFSLESHCQRVQDILQSIWS